MFSHLFNSQKLNILSLELEHKLHTCAKDSRCVGYVSIFPYVYLPEIQTSEVNCALGQLVLSNPCNQGSGFIAVLPELTEAVAL